MNSIDIEYKQMQNEGLEASEECRLAQTQQLKGRTSKKADLRFCRRKTAIAIPNEVVQIHQKLKDARQNDKSFLATGGQAEKLRSLRTFSFLTRRYTIHGERALQKSVNEKELIQFQNNNPIKITKAGLKEIANGRTLREQGKSEDANEIKKSWGCNFQNFEMRQNFNKADLLNWTKKHKKKQRRISDAEAISARVSEMKTSLSSINIIKKAQQNSESKRYFKILYSPEGGEGLSSQKKQFQKSDFFIGRMLGKGNFAEVYIAQHKKSGYACAMKIMSKFVIKKENYVNQIVREVAIQSYIKHPNVACLYGVFDDEQNVYLLLELCVDGQLLSCIKKSRRLQEEQVSRYMQGICHGVNNLHEEMVIHRDLKPENILLCFGVPKIADFGWAVYRGVDGGLRETTSGSPLYYPPEMVQKVNYDEKIDVWGIGMICYECIVGLVPFKVYSYFNLNRIVLDQLDFPNYVDISGVARDFIEKCLKKKAGERWSVTDMLKHDFLKPA